MIYDWNNLDDLPDKVDQAVSYLRANKDRFDFIAVRGCSGMLVGAPVALQLGKPLVIVRKPDEKSHSFAGTPINSTYADGRYIFLDDFIGTGATRDAVHEGLKEYTVKHVGNYLYSRDRAHQWFEPREVAA